MQFVIPEAGIQIKSSRFKHQIIINETRIRRYRHIKILII